MGQCYSGRRGNTYQGIMLDPPAYGHGPDGEKWKLERNPLIASGLQKVLPRVALFVLDYVSKLYAPA